MQMPRTFALALTSLLVTLNSGCGQATGGGDPATAAAARVQESAGSDSSPSAADNSTAQLVLAGGCFWCLEAAFEQLRGVSDVVSGYAGGSRENADYETVSSGRTNHAEAIRIRFDPSRISRETLLRVFFLAAHDPTQINRQYPDVGRQYRSAVFYADEDEKELAAGLIRELNESRRLEKKVATMLEPLDEFYAAEDYHQDYVAHHPQEPYVIAYSLPRVEKVRQAFPELIR